MHLQKFSRTAYSVEKPRNLKNAILREKRMVCESRVGFQNRRDEVAQQRWKESLADPCAKAN